jgi:hypothetical protein
VLEFCFGVVFGPGKFFAVVSENGEVVGMGLEDVSENVRVDALGFNFVGNAAESPFDLILLHFGSVFTAVATAYCSFIVLFHVGWYGWVGG